MSSKPFFQAVVTGAVLTALLVTQARAGDLLTSTRGESVGDSYTKEIGSKDSFWAGVVVSESASNQFGQPRVHARATANAVLFDTWAFNAVGAYADASRDPYRGTGSASFRLFLGGLQLYNQTSPSAVTYSANLSRKYIQVDRTFVVGPVPVTVSVSAGVGLTGTLTLAQSGTGVTAKGSAKAYAWGSGRFGAGIPGYNISLELLLQLFRTGFRTDVAVPAYGSISGYAEVFQEALRIKLRIVVSAWPFEWARTIASWSYGGWVRTLFAR